MGIYAGDSEGSLLKFNAPKDWRSKCEFQYEFKIRGIHKFGLQQVLHCKKESCTFTIGYDQMIRGYGASLDQSQVKSVATGQAKEEREDFFSM